MNVQLLLLLALVGPFCAFTHASPTEHPIYVSTDLDRGTTGIAAGGAFEGTTEVTEIVAITPPATDPLATTEQFLTDVVTTGMAPSNTANTEEPDVKTEAPATTGTVAPDTLITVRPAVETVAPSRPAETEVIPTATVAAEADTGEEMLLEDDTEEGLSSGQVVGIVIAALLAVVIVIAVVIAAVRRMGKYSSARNKNPAKKDSIMVSPLRKRQAKQPERPKFWKF